MTDIADIIRRHGTANSSLEAPEGEYIRGTSTLVDLQDGTARLQWVKTDRKREALADDFRKVVADMCEPLRGMRSPTTLSDPAEDEIATVIAIGDPHFGMYSWAPETGSSWDLTIAEDVHYEAARQLIEAAPRCGRIHIMQVGDLSHADDETNRTRRSGHHLDTDGRRPKVLATIIRTLRRIIDLGLAHASEVLITNCKGNHDDETSFFVSLALSLLYELEPRVHVEVQPQIAHAYRWGACMYAGTHGHTIKPTALGEVMATEWPQDWGETQHRKWYTGHIHHKTVHELRGCTVESLNTLAARDYYAASHAYNSQRSMKADHWHCETGIMSTHVVGINQVEAALAAKNVRCNPSSGKEIRS